MNGFLGVVMENAAFWIRSGSLLAALAIVTGAFGAHGLQGQLSPAMMSVYEKAVHYHAYHALGLFVVAFVRQYRPEARRAIWAGRLMLVGIVFFSGSLYVLSLTGLSWLGAVTPIGGLAFIAAWLMLFFAVSGS
jgi:uncharacterized membrane protein YgdD (TMEM256/DUF423 family)